MLECFACGAKGSRIFSGWLLSGIKQSAKVSMIKRQVYIKRKKVELGMSNEKTELKKLLIFNSKLNTV